MTGARERRSHIFPAHRHQWYVEPEICTAQLAAKERFPGVVWDPCCGQGNIVRTLIGRGVNAFGSDVVRRAGIAPWFIAEIDFLAENSLTADHIVMNPPFYRAKGAEAFIRKAIALVPGKVAAFVELRFLAGDGRANGLFDEFPPARIYMVTPRPSCPPGEYLRAGGKAQGGTADYIWIVWDNGAPKAAPTFHWLTAGDA